MERPKPAADFDGDGVRDVLAGMNPLRELRPGAYSNDLYPGVDGLLTRFGSDTFPNSSNYYFWAGSEPKFGYSGVTVEAITQDGQDITATLSFVPWTPGKK
jgi:hypothetical protein